MIVAMEIIVYLSNQKCSQCRSLQRIWTNSSDQLGRWIHRIRLAGN